MGEGGNRIQWAGGWEREREWAGDWPSKGLRGAVRHVRLFTFVLCCVCVVLCVSLHWCWGLELTGWGAVLADMGACGAAMTGLSMVNEAGGNAGLVFRKEARGW